MVTGRYGTIGQVFYVDGQFWPLNTALYVRDFKGSDPIFISYFLKTVRWSKFTDKAAVPGVNRNHVHMESVTVPPLAEQRRIAAVLGALDDKIELNRKMNRTLEAMAQALFKSWFIDFDGVPESELVESALGPIPKGWAVKPLSNIAVVTMGNSPKGDTYNEQGDGVPLINGPAQYGDFFPVKTKWTTSPTRLSQSGDLILCVRGSTTGRRVVSDGVYCLGRGVCSIRARSACQEFARLSVHFALSRLLTKTTGSVFPNLSGPSIKSLQVVVPERLVLDEFSPMIDAIRDRLLANVWQSRTLANLRDTLLPKLISGEIRVPEAERTVEAAL